MINYKMKYEQLKSQYVNSLDVSFRLGFEQGMQAAQLEQLQQQQQMLAQQPQPGQEGQPGTEEPQTAPEGGSELDNHISQLEQLVQKSEIKPEELKKALDDLKSFKQMSDLQKSLKTIKSIKMKPAFVIGKQATVNLDDTSKKALSMQEKIVGDIMETWKSEEASAEKGILDVLKIEGLAKKE